eukprot:7726992-Ditylum_brightwellii.AAC.1
MHNWLNTSYQKQKFYKYAVSDCPVCCAHGKTWQYLFQCQYEDALAIRTLALPKFKASLTKLKTAPNLQQVLYYFVMKWCRLLCGSHQTIPTDEVGDRI